MTDYFVASSGSDAANGLTLATAWASVLKATGQSTTTSTGIGAGDTCYVRTGTYTSSSLPASQLIPAYNPANNGVPGRPIAFRAYTDPVTGVRDTPILDCTKRFASTGTSANPVFGASSVNYIVWDGFSVPALDNKGVAFNISVGSVLENCTINVGPRMSTASTDAGTDNYYALFIQQCTNITIRNNTLMNAYTNLDPSDPNAGGIVNFDSQGVLGYNNTIVNVGDAVDDKEGAQDNQWLRNHILPTGGGRAYQVTGFTTARCASWDCSVQRLIFKNNLVILSSSTARNNYGVNFNLANGSTNVTGIYRIESNTFHNADIGVRMIDNFPGVRILNNIFNMSGNTPNFAQQWAALGAPATPSTDLVSEFNLYNNLAGTLTFDPSETGGSGSETFAQWKAAGRPDHALGYDSLNAGATSTTSPGAVPGFTSAASTAATQTAAIGFKVTSTSAAYQTGRTATSTSAGSAINIGCYSYGTEVIGVPTSLVLPIIGTVTT